jgi:nucleotide-binding universal stress UspA family protein
MFRKILLPLDGSLESERAIDPAMEFGKSTGAEILLLRVIPPPWLQTPEAGPAEEYKLAAENAGKAAAYLEKVASRFAGESVKTRILVPCGEAHSEILRAAHDEDVDFIVMTTHGGTALERALLGSTAEKVVWTTRRPVFLVKPEKGRIAHHIDEAEVFGGAVR